LPEILNLSSERLAVVIDAQLASLVEIATIEGQEDTAYDLGELSLSEAETMMKETSRG
jgi:hypothetical protein